MRSRIRKLVRDEDIFCRRQDAVVDPKQEDCTYPFKGLCGAAVAYKLVEALMEAMGKDAEDADYLMENVAIATIGDVMDLVERKPYFR